jgi:hypothetical protein
MITTPADWCELGLQLVGFDKSRQKCHRTNLERFVSTTRQWPMNSSAKRLFTLHIMEDEAVAAEHMVNMLETINND